MPNFKESQYKLRFSIGILGAALPLLLLYGHDFNFLSSMSHYYYTASTIFFIGIISSFSLVLLCYQGYPKEESEKLSDNQVTSWAGFFAVLAVLIPTASGGAIGELDYYTQPYLYGYDQNKIVSAIHLICAGFFLALLGYMSFAKFTYGQNNKNQNIRLFKICGILVWVSIGLILLFKSLEFFTPINDFNNIIPYYVFWLETAAIWSFALAWLVKAQPRTKIFFKPTGEID